LSAAHASGQVSTNTSDAGTAAALISQYRVAHGLSPVSVDLRLTQAATAQARTVAEAGNLSHGQFSMQAQETPHLACYERPLAGPSDCLTGRF